MSFLRGRATQISTILCLAILLLGLGMLMLRPANPTLGHPMIVVLTIPLLILSLQALRRDSTLIQWDSLLISLLAMSALPILRVDLGSVFVLGTLILSIFWLRTSWRGFRSFIVWVFFLVGIFCAELNLITVIVNAPIPFYSGSCDAL